MAAPTARAGQGACTADRIRQAMTEHKPYITGDGTGCCVRCGVLLTCSARGIWLHWLDVRGTLLARVCHGPSDA